MVAFLLTYALFAYFFFIGYGILTFFPTGLKKGTNFLLSPSAGVAAVILPVFCLNRYGVAVKDFALLLAIILFLGAALAIWIKKPVISKKRVFVVGVLSFLTLLVAAWPFLWFGFDWVSIGNDDMANYCLGAQRFFYKRYFDLPNMEDIRNGINYSDAFWFMHVEGGSRAGSELLIAWTWGVVGVEAPRIFMAVITALHVSFGCSVAAFASALTKKRYAWLVSFALFVINPLSIWGVEQQLIGQVGGLMFLVSALVLLFRPVEIHDWSILKKIISAYLIMMGLLIWYPEALPFLGLGGIIYVFTNFWLVVKPVRKYLVLWPALVGVFVVGFMPQYAFTAVKFLMMQSASVGRGVVGDPTALLFPYYLVPTGIPALWGFIPVHLGIPAEPKATLLFIFGVFCTLCLGWALIKEVRKGNAVTGVLIVMFGLWLELYHKRNDFGLYKLAMYAQPFMIALAVSFDWKNFFKRRWMEVSLLGFILTLQCLTAFCYTWRSTGEGMASCVEIFHGSSRKFLSSTKEAFDAIGIPSNKQVYVSTVDNVVIAKLMAFYSRGHRLVFPARDYIGGIASYSSTPALYSDYTEARAKNESSTYIVKKVNFSGLETVFFEPNELKDIYHDGNYEKIAICNSSIFSENGGKIVKIEKKAPAAIFVHSTLGAHYYSGNRKHASFFQVEPDPFLKNYFSSIGRYFLLQVPGYTKGDRMLFDITATQQKQRGCSLPAPLIKGEDGKEIQVSFVGRGAGRLYSAPFSVKEIDGIPYILVDMNVVPETFKNRETLLSHLYGSDILVDMRRLTAFARNISIVSEQEYTALKPPHKIDNLLVDLRNPALQYSGIFEDGWLSEESFFILAPEKNSKFFVLKGMIPQIKKNSDFKTTLTVKVAGKEIAQKELGLGAFEIKIPTENVVNEQRIDLSFSNYQQFAGRDGRYITARINFLGFTEN